MIIYNRYSNKIPFLDILMNVLLIFVFLFTLAYLQIKKDTSKTNIKTKAEFVITVTWEDNDTNDVDTWVEDPFGKTVSYLHREEGLTHLDRDDTGKVKDTITLPTGEKISYDKNQEITTIRGIVPGEWVINIHMYRMDYSDRLSNVTVEMVKLNPSRTIVIYKKFVLEKYWQEITVARVTISNSGEVLLVDDLPKKLVPERSWGWGR